jgi:putative ABC transport system permease protein
MKHHISLRDTLHDLRISLRGLRRSRLMTLTVVLTVGIGIGATTAIFSAIYAALLQPLPYTDPDRLVRLYTDSPPNKFRFSAADYLALQQQQTHFEQIAAYTGRATAFSDGVVAERLQGRDVTWSYFGVLGIQPAAGRDFEPADGQPGNPLTVILSHGFWQRRLGGRLDVVGRPIRLDGLDYVVVGVLPAALGPLEQQQEFFTAAQLRPPQRKGPFLYTVVARLRDNAQASAAAAELREINRRIFPLWRSSYQDEKATWAMMPLRDFVVGDVTIVAALAFVAVSLVWLIATANASNLLVARLSSRRRELAVRTALGASRLRVLQHLLGESLLLAVGSALVGLILAWTGVRLLREFGGPYFPRTQEIALDGSALGLLIVLTAASGLLFGLIPALRASGSMEDSLKSSGRSATGSIGVRRLRKILVATQFAIATPLLIVAGLLLFSLNELQRVDLGFDTANLITGSIQLPAAQYQEAGAVAAFWSELQRRMAALPGVRRVAFADGRPPNDVGNFNNFDLEDFPAGAGDSQPVTPWVAVSPEYFDVLGLTLIEGRLLSERDGQAESVESVVVDRAWANRFFPKQSVVGKRFREGGCTTCPWTAVVGVVSAVKYAGLDRPDAGTVYWAIPPTERFRYAVIRAATNAAAVLPSVQQVVRDMDATVPLSNVATIDDLVGRALQRPKSLSLLIGCLAAVALGLSMIGIYGVMAYYVEQHRKDICIRLALGGSPANVLAQVVGEGMSVVVAGLVIGLLAAVLCTRWVSVLLFRVSAIDGLAFGATCLALLLFALAACLVPASRAAQVEPAVVLREE